MEGIYILVALLCGLVGVAASIRGRWNPVVGFIAGFVLGPLAILLFLVDGIAKAPSRAIVKTCPQCCEQVHMDARICRFCRHEFKW